MKSIRDKMVEPEPWWAGVQLHCNHCGGSVELEATDDLSGNQVDNGHDIRRHGIQLAVPCLHCNKELRVNKQAVRTARIEKWRGGTVAAQPVEVTVIQPRSAPYAMDLPGNSDS